MVDYNRIELRERLIELSKICYIRTPSAVMLTGGAGQLYALREMEKVAHELRSLALRPGEYSIETLQTISDCLVKVQQILREYGTGSEVTEAREAFEEVSKRIQRLSKDTPPILAE